MAKSRKVSTFREYAEALLIAGIFLGFSNTFVVKTFYIPSASMEETLLVGDRLFVNRFIYGNGSGPLASFLPSREIERGDIVIFRSPEDPTQDMVKRCIGLPGDTLEMIDKDLYLNGEWVDDGSYTRHTDPNLYRQRDSFDSFVVPEGHLFCLGDNRDRSKDSRFWGPVPRHYVEGRALLIYWSFGGETPDGQWHGWRAKAKQLWSTLTGFPTQTRWNRTFHLVR